MTRPMQRDPHHPDLHQAIRALLLAARSQVLQKVCSAKGLLE
jgi:hypothetical protein